MFLYAKVVLDNLISQESPADLDDELTQDHFPRGLNAACETLCHLIVLLFNENS